MSKEFEFDMFDPDSDDFDRQVEEAENVSLPIIKAVCDIEDFRLFRSVIASCIENWAYRNDYDSVYLAIGIANLMAEAHQLFDEDLDDDEDDDE